MAGRKHRDLDTFELMPIAPCQAHCRPRPFAGRRYNRRPPLHLLRNVFHFTAQNLWFYALALIPLAQVFAWNSLLLFGWCSAPLVLRERPTRLGLIAVFLGFLHPGNCASGLVPPT